MRRTRRVLVLFLLVAVILAGLCSLVFMGYRQYLYTAYPLQYKDYIFEISETYDVTPSLICAVICTESHFIPTAKSHAGAVGLMQMTPDTFRWAQTRAGVKNPLSEEHLTDPYTNIRYGTYTLKLLHEMFEDPTAALAAYNAGQGTVTKWLKDPAYSKDGVHLDTIPYKETANYVKKVKNAQTIYKDLYGIH